jgi:hypothetical protein
MSGDEYFYDYGWLFEDNIGRALRVPVKDLLFRVVKHYRDGRMDTVTDPTSRDDAIAKLKQIKLLDPIGQEDWVEEWKQEQQDRKAITNDYLRAKGRL